MRSKCAVIKRLPFNEGGSTETFAFWRKLREDPTNPSELTDYELYKLMPGSIFNSRICKYWLLIELA
jgi:hypothetical protein